MPARLTRAPGLAQAAQGRRHSGAMDAELKAWALGFKRAGPKESTRFVFVGNAVPHDAIVDIAAVRAAFEQCGRVQAVVPFRTKRFLVTVVMRTPEGARRAVDTLGGESGMRLHELGRPLKLHLSKPRKPPGASHRTPDSVTMSASIPLPRGLILVPNFVTEREEDSLVAALDDSGWRSDFSRRVQHFGYAFNYGTRNVDPAAPIEGGLPEFVRAVLPGGSEGFRRGLGQADASALAASDQCTANEYLPGQGIRPHIDTREAFGGHIASLSLLSDIVMDFRRGADKKSIVLPRRSLLLLTGPSRHEWSHGIAHRRDDVIEGSHVARTRRVSVTFRRVLHSGTAAGAASSAAARLNPLQAPAVERDYVHKTYERIAKHFSHTRWALWPQVRAFLTRYGGPQSLVFDIGCGNGKSLAAQRELGGAGVGIDMCSGLVSVCADRGLDAASGDALHVPLRSGACDVAVSVAVVHHISTHPRRVRLCRELLRVLRPGGRGLITAWAREQPSDSRRSFTRADVMVAWQMPRRFVTTKEWDEAQSEGEHTKGDNVVLQRYCHVFSRGELPLLLQEAAKEPPQYPVVMKEEYFDKGNWCVEFIKAREAVGAAGGKRGAAMEAAGVGDIKSVTSISEGKLAKKRPRVVDI